MEFFLNRTQLESVRVKKPSSVLSLLLLLLGNIVAKKSFRFILNISYLQKLVAAPNTLSFFSPALTRLHKTQKHIYSGGQCFPPRRSSLRQFSKTKCSWENGNRCRSLVESLTYLRPCSPVSLLYSFTTPLCDFALCFFPPLITQHPK